MRPVELIRNRLDVAGLNYHGPEHDFMAQCPSHDDRSPSLHITEGDGGTALIHCVAGCRSARIVQDLGLKFRDLFANGTSRPQGPVKPKLVPVAGGGMATRAQRDVIERETGELVRQWADNFEMWVTIEDERPGIDWERAWDIAAARSGIER